MKKVVTTLALIIGIINAYSQSFTEQIVAKNSDWINPKPIDLNQDGYIDLVSVSRFGEIAYWQKDALMNFTKITLNDDYNSWNHFDVFDIDGDTDLDIIASGSGITFKIYYNDGNQNFSTSQQISTSSNINHIIAGDFDSDGDGDVIVAGNGLKLLKNETNNSFSETIIDNNIPVLTGNMVANDIDNDGDLDLLISINSFYQGNKIKCYLNDGNANFTEHVINYTLANQKIKVLDYDNDGDKDFFVVRNFSIVLFTNDGNLNFSNTILNNVTLEGIKDAYIVDSENDGDFDIVAVFSPTFGDHYLMFYLNDGNDNFSLNTLGDLQGGEYVFAQDLNGSGYSDLIVTSEFMNDPQVHQNLGGNSFNLSILDTSLILPLSFNVGDLNNNGLLDIVTTSEISNNELAIWTNLGNYEFEKQVIDYLIHPIYGAHMPINYAEIIDFNNDGYNDILATSNEVAPVEGLIFLYISDGIGNFTKSTIDISGEKFYRAFTVDIDNDGDLDIVYSNYSSSGEIKYLQNDGNFNYQVITVENNLNYTKCKGYIDVNNDGYKDLVTNKNLYLQNDGNNNFNQISLSKAGEFFDVDGDGDYDYISSMYNSASNSFVFSWHENNGSGSFTEHEISNSSSSNYGDVITLQDFDADGDVDIVTTRIFSFWENDGNQSFTETSINTNQGNIANHILSADFNNNGKIDILTSFNKYPFTIWENTTALSVNDFETDKSLVKIYPNPTTNYINIQSNFDINSVEVYSLQGQKVLLVENQKTINISSLSKGIYFLKVKTVNGEITKKIIKQ